MHTSLEPSGAPLRGLSTFLPLPTWVTGQVLTSLWNPSRVGKVLWEGDRKQQGSNF